MSIEDLTRSATPASMPAADRTTLAYALIAATAGDAPAETGGRLEHAVKDVFALYGVDADGWTDMVPDPGRERPRPQAA